MCSQDELRRLGILQEPDDFLAGNQVTNVVGAGPLLKCDTDNSILNVGGAAAVSWLDRCGQLELVWIVADPRRGADRTRGYLDLGRQQPVIGISDHDHVVVNDNLVLVDAINRGRAEGRDLLALAPGDDPDVAEARKLKAEWLRVRASEVSSFVSRSLYLSSSRLIEKNRGGVVGIR